MGCSFTTKKIYFKALYENIIEKQIKYGYTKAAKFIAIHLKNGYKTMTLLRIQHIMKKNLLLLKTY